MKLVLDKRFCIGCKTCEVACMDRWNLTVSLLTVEESCNEKEGDLKVCHTLHTCLQCKDPHCLKSCQQHAIQIVSGIVRIDRSKCIGCGNCSKACPTASLWMVEKGNAVVPYKCELCGVCVASCPSQALTLLEE